MAQGTRAQRTSASTAPRANGKEGQSQGEECKTIPPGPSCQSGPESGAVRRDAYQAETPSNEGGRITALSPLRASRETTEHLYLECQAPRLVQMRGVLTKKTKEGERKAWPHCFRSCGLWPRGLELGRDWASKHNLEQPEEPPPPQLDIDDAD